MKAIYLISALFLSQRLYAASADSSSYIKATFTAQIWSRFTEFNPGSTVFGNEKKQGLDIGLRRVRTQVFGKVTKNVFFYTQFGINNFNSISARKSPIFFHDVLAEYYITPRTLQMGMGLTAWTGFARYSSPSVATIMGYDAPLVQQATNDVNDQFLRKLSIYAKGKLGKLDYRLILSDPMAVQNSPLVGPISTNSDFSMKPAKLQTSGYLMYQFRDEESNLTPYNTGTYLGKKKVFNIGAGFQYQPDAMWHWNDPVNKDTVFEDMLHLAADIYLDQPLGSHGAAIHFYGSYMNLGFGKNYLRSQGAMNMANGIRPGTDNLNGGGNAVPLFGTGSAVTAQLGYLLPDKTLGERNGKLQVYGMFMGASYDRLNEPMYMYDAGLNWYIDATRAKLTLNYQNRPVFRISDAKVSQRASSLILQFQVAI